MAISERPQIVDENVRINVKPHEHISTMITIYTNIHKSNNPSDIMQAIELAENIGKMAIELKQSAMAHRAEHLKLLGVVE